MKFIITTLLFGGALALPATTGYDPCPGSGLQGNPTCCELNLAGVIAGECIARKFKCLKDISGSSNTLYSRQVSY